MTKEKIETIARGLCWKVDWYISCGNKWVRFSVCSPYGQDFNIELCYINYDQLVDELFTFCKTFDVSYETYIWLDEHGHGKNGAPYELIDVYKDMEACEKMMFALYQALNKEYKKELGI